MKLSILKSVVVFFGIFQRMKDQQEIIKEQTHAIKTLQNQIHQLEKARHTESKKHLQYMTALRVISESSVNLNANWWQTGHYYYGLANIALYGYECFLRKEMKQTRPELKEAFRIQMKRLYNSLENGTSIFWKYTDKNSRYTPANYLPKNGG